MEDIRLDKYDYCNFCYATNSTIGITWRREGEDKYYHVCDKCAEVFSRRGINKYDELKYKTNDPMQIDKIAKAHYAKRDVIRSLLTCGTPKRERITLAYREHLNIFTDEEEEMIAAYASEIHAIKSKAKKDKGRQTYVRNRLNDKEFEKKLIENGWISTAHYGVIYFYEILQMGSWTEQELEIINRIAKACGEEELGNDKLKISEDDAARQEEIDKCQVEEEILATQ